MGPRRRRSSLPAATALQGAAVVVLAAVAVLAAPASAGATPPAIALDAYDNGSPPQIAYAPSTGTTYVAWQDPHGQGIELCVLPGAAATCESGAPILLNDTKYAGYKSENEVVLGGVVVLSSGEVVVVGAPVVGGAVAWASKAGGSEFLSGEHGLRNGGSFISDTSLFYGPNNAVALNGTDVGLLDDSNISGLDFNDAPYDATAASTAPVAPDEQLYGRAIGSDGPQLAAEPAPPPAAAGSDVVVGVGANLSSAFETVAPCINFSASGYGVSVGKVEGKSNAAGTLNQKGLPNFGLLSCTGYGPVLAEGGADGIGDLEEVGSTFSGAGSEDVVQFRLFHATATGGTFGEAVPLANVTEEKLAQLNATDLSEDSGTGVYALWENDRGQVKLDYSPNGGAGWEGPAITPAVYGGSDVVAGTGSGGAEIAYEANTGPGAQIFLQRLTYQEVEKAPVRVSTRQKSGKTSGGSIRIGGGVVGETDRASLSGENAGGATGSVTYTLYSKSSCSSSSAVFHSTAGVAGGSPGSSAKVGKALSAGKYYWRASYSGNVKNAPSVSSCGGEVLTAEPALKLGSKGMEGGGAVTVSVKCETKETCRAKITIEETVHHKVELVASGSVKLHGGKSKDVVLHLTSKGKHLWAHAHGHLRATVAGADKTSHGTVHNSSRITIRP